MPAERVAMRHVRETQERASPTNPQVQQQQQASAYSVRNGVERVPTLDAHANPVSEIHRPASRRPPGGIIPESPGGFAGILEASNRSRVTNLASS